MARIATIGGWNFPIGNQGGIWLLSTSMTRALRPLRVRASNQPANRGRVCPPYWRRIARPAAGGENGLQYGWISRTGGFAWCNRLLSESLPGCKRRGYGGRSDLSG